MKTYVSLLIVLAVVALLWAPASVDTLAVTMNHRAVAGMSWAAALEDGKPQDASEAPDAIDSVELVFPAFSALADSTVGVDFSDVSPVVVLSDGQADSMSALPGSAESIDSVLLSFYGLQSVLSSQTIAAGDGAENTTKQPESSESPVPEDSPAFSAALNASYTDLATMTLHNMVTIHNPFKQEKKAMLYGVLRDEQGVSAAVVELPVDLAPLADTAAHLILPLMEDVRGINHTLYLWDTSLRPLLGPPVAVNQPVQMVQMPTIVTLDTSSLLFTMGVHESQMLTATIGPDDAVNKTLVWSSADSSIATVNESGRVTAHKAGSTTITAKAQQGGVWATCDVTVIQPAENITLDKHTLTLAVTEDGGQSHRLDYTVSPADTTDSTVIWTSSDETVAVVSQDGTVTAKGAGSAVIAVTAADGSGVSDSCAVTVEQGATVVEISHTAVSMWDTTVFPLTATALVGDRQRPLSWASSDPEVASVDANGNVTAKSKGAAVITARADGVEAQCAVTVYRESDYIGVVSAQYESNGKPGEISSGAGDTGGKSYGAYQFSSRWDVPLSFAKWLGSSGRSADYSARLIAAYNADGKAYGTHFDAEWKALAAADGNEFLSMQHDYIKSQYYDPLISKLRADGFDANAYGLAMKNALWSRAVQHGVSGAHTVITRAFAAIGGFIGKTEDVLILTIYAESGAVVSSPPSSSSIPMTGKTAEDNGISGKYMKYYGSNSSSVQLGVWRRLNINESNALLALLASPPVTPTPLPL